MNPSVLCFGKIPVTKEYMDKRGEYQNFPSKVACLTVSKNFVVVEPFRVSLISGTQKVYASESYVTTFDFLSNVFCPTVPNNLVDEPFCDVFQKLR